MSRGGGGGLYITLLISHLTFLFPPFSLYSFLSFYNFLWLFLHLFFIFFLFFVLSKFRRYFFFVSFYFSLIFSFFILFIHLVVCLTTGPKPLPKRAPYIVRSKAFSFIWEYPVLSLRSSSSFLRLFHCLPVTCIPPCIFPSVTRCRRQFLRKMWPIQFAFRLRISCRIFLCCLTLSNTSSFLTWSVQLVFFILLQHHISKLSRCFWSTVRSVQVSAPYKAMLQT